LSIPDLMMILRSILEKNGLWGSPEIPREFKLEGLKSIASCALGSAREAIQILEKCITGGFLTVEQIKENIEKAAIESRVEEVLVSLINGNREEFFTLVSQNFDTMEFLKLGYYKIARAIIYKESGTLDYESYEGFYKKLIESSNFDLLCGFFRKFSAMAENFIRLGDFILLSSDYFREWKMPLRGSKK
jgi:DNA polymerase III delta prime subunit